MNEMNVWHYKEQNTRSSDTPNNFMKFTLQITEAWFLHVRGKFLEELQNGKNSTKLENDLWNKMKRREARQNWKKKENKAIEKNISED